MVKNDKGSFDVEDGSIVDTGCDVVVAFRSGGVNCVSHGFCRFLV